jgi:CubicO group peptidase (beta-lactamase class C family)
MIMPNRLDWTRKLRLAVVALFVASATTCATSGSTTSEATVAHAVFPGAEWERIERPESVGWTAADLDSVRARLSKLSTTGFMAVVGGRALMEYGDVQVVSYLASVRKSILAMLYGNYVASGKVRLDKTLAELGIDDIGGLTEEEKRATIRDLITARSGVYHAASNDGDDLASAPPRGSQKHGTYMLYSNWDFNAAGTAFELETGRNIYDALDTDLAQPLGMRDFNRASHRRTGDSTKSKHLAYHINLSTRDMARIGYLMLREGNWNGRQLVPQNWVREITRPFTPVSEMNPERRRAGPFGYGHLWWVWDGPHATGGYRGAYTGLGAVGQQITVLPVLDMVVVHKTRPGQGRSVSHQQYLEVLDVLVKAGCRQRKC